MKLPELLKTGLNAVQRFRPGKRVVRYVGYSTLFSILFSFFLFFTLPFNRFIPNIESLMSNALGRKVHVGDISTTLTGAVVLSSLEIGLGDKQSDESRDSEGQEESEASSGLEKEEEHGDSEGGGTKAKARSKVLPTYLFDELTVNVGMLSMLFGKLDVEAEISGLGGTVELSYEGAMPGSDNGAGNSAGQAKSPVKKHSSTKSSTSRSKRRSAARSRARGRSAAADEATALENEETTDEETVSNEESTGGDEASNENVPVSFSLKAEGINLKSVHDLRSALPFPIDGTLNLEMELSSPTSGFAAASGKISFSIRNLLLSKKGYEAVIMGSSLVVPPLSISSIEGEIVFENGVGKITKFKVVSKDIDISLKGEIILGDKLKEGRNDLYAMFKIEEPYLNQSAAIRTIIESADTFSAKARQAHRDDGYYGFKYYGTFGKGRFTPSKEFRMEGDTGDDSTGKSTREERRRRRAMRASKGKTKLFGPDDNMDIQDEAEIPSGPTFPNPGQVNPQQNMSPIGPRSYDRPQDEQNREFEPPPEPVQQEPMTEPPPPPMMRTPGFPVSGPDEEEMNNPEAPPETPEGRKVEEEPPQQEQEEQQEQQEQPEEQEQQEQPEEQEQQEENPPPSNSIDPDEIY